MNIALLWFREDLRLIDNPAFSEASNNHEVIIPLYIFDKDTSALGQAQQWWLHHSLKALDNSLQQYGLNLLLRQGKSIEIIDELVNQLAIDTIYWNRCYTPVAIKRDIKIKALMIQKGIEVKSTNGSLLNEPWTIKNKQGEYFKVFTPYWKHCLQRPGLPKIMEPANHLQKLDILSDHLTDWNLEPKNPNWASGFTKYWQPGEEGANKKLHEFIDNNLLNYKANRDFPAKNATSRLSPHLHFGEISPWTIWRAVEIAKLDKSCNIISADHFLSELGWREFSNYLLYHFPDLPHSNFRKEFDAFPWREDELRLKCWQKGMTGYPIIDAGMRELWATGYMHNRVRMIVASFLCKDLLIDWRRGADWFLNTLVDADLANNSASWQWVAGCGADAAPYFRIFNPLLQSEKFDPDGIYIRSWVPELAQVNNQYIHQPWLAPGLALGKEYPKPVIDHNEARKRALFYYKTLKNKGNII
ncbi:MAG: deoxyribodipyrimidine photo-lyase [Tatlockia sp.]|nr:deoxyribodipyrimidine photo-lyase [Tatlockia sp.]